MPEITIDIDDRAITALYARLPDALGRALRGTLESASALVLRDLSSYPPQRAGSAYRRTGTLSRSWSRTAVQGSGLEQRVVVGSNANQAPYNRLVQDSTRQATVHAVTWRDKTVQAVARNQEDAIRGMFEARIEAELR